MLAHNTAPFRHCTLESVFPAPSLFLAKTMNDCQWFLYTNTVHHTTILSVSIQKNMSLDELKHSLVSNLIRRPSYFESLCEFITTKSNSLSALHPFNLSSCRLKKEQKLALMDRLHLVSDVDLLESVTRMAIKNLATMQTPLYISNTSVALKALDVLNDGVIPGSSGVTRHGGGACIHFGIFSPPAFTIRCHFLTMNDQLIQKLRKFVNSKYVKQVSCLLIHGYNSEDDIASAKCSYKYKAAVGTSNGVSDKCDRIEFCLDTPRCFAALLGNEQLLGRLDQSREEGFLRNCLPSFLSLIHISEPTRRSW